MRSKLRVLIADIETSLMTAFTFRTGKQWIHHNDIKEDWRILSYSAKWLDKKKVMYKEARKDTDEKALLKSLWKLLDEADIVITHNGTIFDGKRINTRFIMHGFKPPAQYKHYDTHRLVKSVADFTSTSLEYLTKKLNKHHTKLPHKQFNGKELWKECYYGNPKAWKEMKKYNNEDVYSLEELYLTLRAWAPDSFPKVFNLTNSITECATCGYKGQMREGTIRRSKKNWYRQNACLKCGAWQPKVRIKKDGRIR